MRVGQCEVWATDIQWVSRNASGLRVYLICKGAWVDSCFSPADIGFDVNAEECRVTYRAFTCQPVLVRCWRLSGLPLFVDNTLYSPTRTSGRMKRSRDWVGDTPIHLGNIDLSWITAKLLYLSNYKESGTLAKTGWESRQAFSAVLTAFELLPPLFT